MQVLPNARLDVVHELPMDDVVELFHQSTWADRTGGLAHRLRMFLTDQEGPVRGVVDAPTFAELLTRVHHSTLTRPAAAA